jgi:hypothetical protein
MDDQPTFGVRQIWREPGTKFGVVIAIAAIIAAGTGLASAADRPASHTPQAVQAAAVGDPEVFVAVSPVRVLDTRGPSNGPIGVATAGPLKAGQQLDLSLTGSAPNRPTAPLPSTAVSAVLNITIDEDAALKSFLTVWPTGEPRPLTSANNAEPGLVSPNLTFARLGGGSVSFYNQQGATNLAVDLVGYTVPLSTVSSSSQNGVPGPAGPPGPAGLSPMSFGQGGPPVDLDGTDRPVATFTPTADGQYVLDGSVSITKTALLSAATNPTLACRWAVGAVPAGPTFRSSLVASVSVLALPLLDLGSSTEVNALGQATLTAGQTASLLCNVTAGIAVTLGAAQATAAAYTATKVG